MSDELQRALEDFEVHVRARPSAERTAIEYARDVAHVYATTRRRSVDAVTRRDLASYFAREDASVRRKARVAAAWRAWREFHAADRVELPDALYRPRRLPKGRARAITMAERERIIDAAWAMPPPRGHGVLLLALTGLRETPAIRVRVSDIAAAPNGVKVLRSVGKGDVQVEIPIAGDLARLVDALTDGARSDDTLLRYRGRPWSVAQIYGAVKAAGRIAGVENLHPHRLRHGFAKWLESAGLPMRTIQAMLGHADIRTTQGYLDVGEADYEAVRAAMRKAA